MIYNQLKVKKINREIVGSNITGTSYDATGYRYASTVGKSLVQVIAEFYYLGDEDLLVGKEAVFLINTNIESIQSIPTNDRREVTMDYNWSYYGDAIIQSDNTAKVIIDRTQIPIFAIAAYCPISTKSVGDTIVLGG